MIAIGCDHAGVEMKKAVIAALEEKGYELLDLGTDGEPCDYPVIAEKVCISDVQFQICCYQASSRAEMRSIRR